MISKFNWIEVTPGTTLLMEVLFPLYLILIGRVKKSSAKSALFDSKILYLFGDSASNLLLK